MRKHFVVLLASGRSSRMKMDVPKQYQKVGEKYLLEYSLETFQTHEEVDEIVLVSLKDYQNLLQKELTLKYAKLKAIISGREERHGSVYEGIQYFSSGRETKGAKVLIHDSARPLVSRDVISNAFEKLDVYSAVTAAISFDDTPLEVREGFVEKTLLRKDHLACQTPQGFFLDQIKKAHDLFRGDPQMEVSDDTSIYRRAFPKEKIAVVEGSPLNFKITRPYQLFLFEDIVSKTDKKEKK